MQELDDPISTRGAVASGDVVEASIPQAEETPRGGSHEERNR